MALLESIMDEARGYSSRVDMSTSLYEDVCATFELQEQLNEASLTYEMAVYLSESGETALNEESTMWQKVKDFFKKWWARAKAFLTKVYLYVKSLVVKLFNKVKNMVVDTFEATVTDIADYKRYFGNIKALIGLFNVKDAVKASDAADKVRDLKEAWSETRANRKAIKINKSQFSQYKALAETAGAVTKDLEKIGFDIDKELSDLAKAIKKAKSSYSKEVGQHLYDRTKKDAEEGYSATGLDPKTVNKVRAAFTSLVGLHTSIFNTLASDIKTFAKNGNGKFEDNLKDKE